MTDTIHVAQVGPYLLDEVIGQGASGLVYRAYDEISGDLVAIKVLVDSSGEDPMTRARFVRECELVGAFAHPGLVRLRARGSTESGIDYLVMDLVQGPNLQDRLEAEPPLSIDEGLAVMLEAADALAAMHRAGWVHRDVKPANFVLDGDGRTRLLDFGLAARFGEGAGERLTEAGFFVGTPLYLAPEQLIGGAPAATMDVYALGAVLYEVLTGRPPFDGPTDVLLTAKTTVEAPAYEGPAPVRSLLASALARDPRERPPDAAAFAAQMRHALAIEPVEEAGGEPTLVVPAFTPPSAGGSSGSAKEVTPMARMGEVIEALMTAYAPRAPGEVPPLRGLGWAVAGAAVGLAGATVGALEVAQHLLAAGGT